jgi:hypothetical protein
VEVPAGPAAQAKVHAPILSTAADIHHDHGVTPHTKVYVGHMALPTDPALIRGSADALILLNEVGGERSWR